MEGYNTADLPLYPNVTSDVLPDKSMNNDTIVDDEASDSSSSDSSYEITKKPKTPTPLPRFKAEVIALAERRNHSEVDINVKHRIKDIIEKCRTRAHHPAAPPGAAEAALCMISRLMARHNLTNEQLRQEVPDLDKSVAGMSSVRVISTKSESTKVVTELWSSVLAQAVGIFFDCEVHSRTYHSRTRVDWNFAGIAQSTRLAAEAYEWIHNLVLEWARDKRLSKKSYCMGIANELYEVAIKDGKKQKEEARRYEEDRVTAILAQEA